MLIEFTVGNFRSIRERQTLSLVVGSGKELAETNVIDHSLVGVPRLLRSAVIFGPNASGKSNIIRAMKFMRTFVRDSAGRLQEGDIIPVTSFRLDSQSRDIPSEFEVLFIQDGTRFQYGFSVTTERVWEEWLMAYPSGKAQRWFKRTYVAAENRYDWYFGPSFRGRKEIIKESTRSNALFLSSAVQLNNEQLKPVFDWFSECLKVVHWHDELPDLYEKYTIEKLEIEETRDKIIRFLQAADLGINNLALEKRTLSVHDLPPDLPLDIQKRLVGKELARPRFIHGSNDADTEIIAFDINDESDGTRSIFALSGPWLEVLEKGSVLFVDELDASLHPLLLKFLVQMFHSNDSNRHNAQLVFTTHHVEVMELMRRDQIWLLEKDEHHATQLYPLSDFSPRKDEAIDKGYLHGRYGGIPLPKQGVL